MHLETPRLILREMTDDDFTVLYRVLGDAHLMCYYPYPFDEARVRSWIARNRERYRVFGFGLWAVCLKDTGEMIGDCGLSMQWINGQINSAGAMPPRRPALCGTGPSPIPPST